MNTTPRQMSGFPDVTVVLPTYNRSAHLRRTLASVLGQRDMVAKALRAEPLPPVAFAK